MNHQPSTINHSSSRAFTLLELLVVIAIIGALMGLLLPVLNAARRRARITRAKKEVKELRDAWEAYRLQYRRFPPNIMLMNSNAIAILRGDAGEEQNPRAIQYLDLRAGLQYYSDPWGTPDSPDRAYRVALDEDGRNEVSGGALGSRVLPVPVAVWSIGPDGQSFTADDITSWEGGWQ